MTDSRSQPASYPDGIGDGHTALHGAHRRNASFLSILILGGLLLAALLGVFGGGKASVRTVEASAATLTVKTPNVMRSGIFFETHISIAAHRPIAKPTLAIPPSLWRDMTINSSIPQADKEAFEDGAFRMEYAALERGGMLEVKIDGQINPPLTLGTKGEIALYDGDVPLARVPLRIRVLP